MIDMSFYVLMAVYFFLLFVWFILANVGFQRNKQIMQEKYLPRSQYPFREILGLGLLFVGDSNQKSHKELQQIAKLNGAFGKKWGIFYFQINKAEKISYAVTLGLIGLLVAPASGEMILLVLVPVLAAIGYAIAMGRVKDIIDEREAELMKQFPNMVSNLAMLINSGMDSFRAWDKVAQSGKGLLYEEMRQVMTEMKTQGVTECQAYINFGERCAIPRIKKFTSMMVQNVLKSAEDLPNFLAYESSICWTEKKNQAKIQGEKAGNKLMIPIFMIMLGFLIMIIGPMAANLGFF